MSAAPNTPLSVMFVCMGNICRSPTAHGVFRDLVHRAGLSSQIHIASSGTHAYHVGESPDSRSVEAAQHRGINLKDLTAQQIHPADFETYDLILAMDQSNFDLLWRNCPKVHQAKLKLFLDYAPDSRCSEVPDPYYGSGNGFERVLDLVEEASVGLLHSLKQALNHPE